MQVNLVGGYYDAGDNVKYGLPMAFTITTLAWSTLSYESELQSSGEYQNALAAIRWGTDYFLKASSGKSRLYVQVGDPIKDHECWVQPEIMNTPRTVLMIDSDTPGTEIAAETSAAMAASSIVFRTVDRHYSRRLLNKAKLWFEFANSRKGTYDGQCPFYCSYSGHNDELLWASTWLYFATKNSKYIQYIREDAISAMQFFFQGDNTLATYKYQADSFICSNLPGSPYHQVYMSPGGMLHLRDGANTQYVTSAALLFSVYSDALARHNQKVKCGDKQFDSNQVLAFAKQQIDYILGKNPEGRSYMVGFGKNPPTQAHHRGASIPKTIINSDVGCSTSFAYWFNKDAPNPNELTGAILGGPNRYDQFSDKRWNSSNTEPCTYVNSAVVGVLAKLAASP
ncbi:hypothetical protein Pint_13656 [Pistacia integerrima]|uniref:Uncharacterized protein n=1 Tax=Pistacia integerrima TaxID=434235 RepID=A0ACC0Y3R5_9ROSI|nr:hypothetical protein Pint_13656 [Pistacia integerrima]